MSPHSPGSSRAGRHHAYAPPGSRAPRRSGRGRPSNPAAPPSRRTKRAAAEAEAELASTRAALAASSADLNTTLAALKQAEASLVARRCALPAGAPLGARALHSAVCWMARPGWVAYPSLLSPHDAAPARSELSSVARSADAAAADAYAAAKGALMDEGGCRPGSERVPWVLSAWRAPAHELHPGVPPPAECGSLDWLHGAR